MLDKHVIKSRILGYKINKLKKLVEQYDNISFFKDVKKIGTDSKDVAIMGERLTGNDVKNRKRGLNLGIAQGLSVEAERKNSMN